MQNPSEQEIDDIIETVTYGGIDYSFQGENILVDFKYLCGILPDEVLIEITDKVKDTIIEILSEFKDNEFG